MKLEKLLVTLSLPALGTIMFGFMVLDGLMIFSSALVYLGERLRR